MNRSMHAHASVGTALLAALAGVALAGRGAAAPAAAPGHAGYSGIGLVGGVAPRPVTLAPVSASRLGVSTAPVGAAAARSGDVEIPLTALVYDPQGRPWTYIALGPHSYERVAAAVDHIVGDRVLLTAGPSVGTPVVTAGGMELLGVEYGVGEE